MVNGSTDTTVRAIQVLAEAVAEALNEVMQTAEGAELRKLGPAMDFSESSLLILEFAARILAAAPDSEVAVAIIDEFSRHPLPRLGRDITDKILEQFTYYIPEVARRNLELHWHVKKFLGKRIGLLDASRGKFYPFSRVAQLLPVDKYLEFKSKALGIPLNQVQLSTTPRSD